MAEWLRRLIRNQLGIARGSSNLSAVDFLLAHSGAIWVKSKMIRGMTSS